MIFDFSRLKHDRRGVATVELALLAPILATMVIGIVDISSAFGRKLVLEQAAQRAIEKVMQTTVDTTVDLTIVNEASAAAKVPVSQVSIDFWLECNDAREADYNTECDAGEKEARYIELTIVDKYTPMFPIHFSSVNADGTYHISATSGIRTR